MLAIWGTNDMQYVIRFARMKLLLQNFEPVWAIRVGLHYAVLCITQAWCFSSKFSKTVTHCETAWWPKGACEASRYHALFCFIVLKDPVKKAVRSISAKILQKHTESSPYYSLPFDPCAFASYCVLVCMHFSQATAFQKRWMYRLLCSISENAEESQF